MTGIHEVHPNDAALVPQNRADALVRLTKETVLRGADLSPGMQLLFDADEQKARMRSFPDHRKETQP
ncbi:hypothetical protein AL036_11775 [Salipiger aestuarii]|uniref:hypothetical protein n=1 Tax=Salipiger aestuarii TaxID=568098 RepID=UPI00025B63E5|nr:hypothetical protein [Salipiger aestuarii]EIE52109.1 hypothetical protein C357_05266 [Citreicella sp. 357]KAA8607140.1 hypothetical protein AL036_11775 [Salipiger aestuarii]KAA8611029.1 hypothetical protein AL037_10875 [Salipiger aestuarii]